ncbi:MAG: hypothetical protein J1F05_00275 [Muribaculaceae bacterium]|nr:hypothetical protein [Muribaculaceae bacterium]
MKRLFTTALVAAVISMGVSAQQFIVLSEGGGDYGNFAPMHLSADGKYLCGNTLEYPFVTDWQNDNDIVYFKDASFYVTGAEARWVTNEGLAVGYDDNGGLLLDFATGKYTVVEPVDVDAGVNRVICEAISEDGSIIIGTVEGLDWTEQPYYWENGVKKKFAIPTSEEAGFKVNGAVPKFISKDASVVVGFLLDELGMRPMLIWHRQDDGEYKYDLVFKDYFQWSSWENGPEGDKPYTTFMPMALSPDGKLVAMCIRENDGVSLFTIKKVGVYDIATGDLEVSTLDGDHGINPDIEADCNATAIANDGTVIGYVGDLDRRAFLMHPEEMQPSLLSMEFDEFENLYKYDLYLSHTVFSISEDGRYITGSGATFDNSGWYAGTEAYVLDTAKGIDSTPSITVKKQAQPEYYTIEGRKLNTPSKGLNIIKDSDGITKKVLIK